MTDKDVLKYLLELGVERLLERNPDFSFDKPTTIQTPPQVEQVPDNEKPVGTSFDEERAQKLANNPHTKV